MIDDRTPRLGSTTPLPRIISVDDHVVEPPHLWQTWLPAKYRDRGPALERRGIGEMEHIGAAPTARRSTPTGPRPTAGSTRTWSTSTNGTWPPSASIVTT